MNEFVMATDQWHTEAGPRIEGSDELDSGKVQAPGMVRLPSGGYRLFYTAVGPGKPFPFCQGYILSAVSDDGIAFTKEPGIRLAPQADLPHMSRRVLAPTLAPCGVGCWRMYFESRGPALLPTVICSAVSTDLLHWELEEGIRLGSPWGVGGPRYVQLPDGRGRLYCFVSEFGPGGLESGERLSQSVISAVTSDGLHFEREPGYRMHDREAIYDNVGITAADVVPPANANGRWMMAFSAWQDVPPGTVVPKHPSLDSQNECVDFATASIAADLAGYRSRIFLAYSDDGLQWERAGCILEGAGYGGEGLDAVHAEDMVLVPLAENRFRMYYAACDTKGHWRIASAINWK